MQRKSGSGSGKLKIGYFDQESWRKWGRVYGRKPVKNKYSSESIKSIAVRDRTGYRCFYAQF